MCQRSAWQNDGLWIQNPLFDADNRQPYVTEYIAKTNLEDHIIQRQKDKIEAKTILNSQQKDKLDTPRMASVELQI